MWIFLQSPLVFSAALVGKDHSYSNPLHQDIVKEGMANELHVANAMRALPELSNLISHTLWLV